MPPSTPSTAQIKYIEDIKDKIDNKRCRELIHTPNFSYKRGVKPDENILEQFYLKPVLVLAPHLLMGGEPGTGTGGCHDFKCFATCKGNGIESTLTPKGWHDKYRYVHSLKSGWYVIQKSYYCKRCKSKTTAESLLDDEEQGETIPDFVRLQIPIIFQRRSAVHRDLATYVVSDAVTGKTFDEIGSVLSTFRATEYLEKFVLILNL